MTISETISRVRRNTKLRARIATAKAAHALLQKITRATANIFLAARANGEHDTMVRASALLHQLQHSHEQLAEVMIRLQTDIGLAHLQDDMVVAAKHGATDW